MYIKNISYLTKYFISIFAVSSFFQSQATEERSADPHMLLKFYIDHTINQTERKSDIERKADAEKIAHQKSYISTGRLFTACDFILRQGHTPKETENLAKLAAKPAVQLGLSDQHEAPKATYNIFATGSYSLTPPTQIENYFTTYRRLKVRPGTYYDFMPQIAKNKNENIIMLVPNEVFSHMVRGWVIFDGEGEWEDVHPETTNEYVWLLDHKPGLPENTYLVFGAYELGARVRKQYGSETKEAPGECSALHFESIQATAAAETLKAEYAAYQGQISKMVEARFEEPAVDFKDFYIQTCLFKKMQEFCRRPAHG